MNMEKEMMYVAPVVEVITVAVEQGYDLSKPSSGQGGNMPEEPF